MGMKRVLVFAGSWGIRRGALMRRARKLGVELEFVTDRCHQLDDPWGDRAMRCILSRRRQRLIRFGKDSAWR